MRSLHLPQRVQPGWTGVVSSPCWSGLLFQGLIKPHLPNQKQAGEWGHPGSPPPPPDSVGLACTPPDVLQGLRPLWLLGRSPSQALVLHRRQAGQRGCAPRRWLGRGTAESQGPGSQREMCSRAGKEEEEQGLVTVLGWDPATPGPEVASTGSPRSSRCPSRGCEAGRSFISALTVHGTGRNQGAPSRAPCDGFSGQRQGTLRNSWPGVVLVCVDRGCLPLWAPGACRPRIGRLPRARCANTAGLLPRHPLRQGGLGAWGVQTRRAVTPTPPGTGGPQAWCADTQGCHPHTPRARGQGGEPREGPHQTGRCSGCGFCSAGHSS